MQHEPITPETADWLTQSTPQEREAAARTLAEAQPVAIEAFVVQVEIHDRRDTKRLRLHLKLEELLDHEDPWHVIADMVEHLSLRLKSFGFWSKSRLRRMHWRTYTEWVEVVE